MPLDSYDPLSVGSEISRTSDLGHSIDVKRPDRLDSLLNIHKVVVVGSSGTGKTTVVNAARDVDGVHVPKRFLTRPPRANDDFTENGHLTPDQFSDGIDSGEIAVYWTRNMEGDRTERYGFVPTSPEDGVVTVLSGNNALYNNRVSINPDGVLDDETVWVGVYASVETLIARLEARSPDMVSDRPGEFAYRISDLPENVLPHVDFVVNTDGEFGDGRGPDDFRQLVCRLVELARREYVVTSGAKYADIDVLASVAAYSELLRLLGKNARAVVTAPFNETVSSTVRSWSLPVEQSFEADSENVRFVLADVSDPKYAEPFVDKDRVVQVFDHHAGMEDFWGDRLVEGSSHIEPVGACATLIWERFKAYGKDGQISTTVANLLYTAIYSNTLALNSSVTTERDRTALDELSRYVELPDDWGAQYYREIEENIVSDVVGAVSNDTKRFDIDGRNYAIAQLEVWDAGRLLADPDFIEKIKAGMAIDDSVDKRWFLNLVSIGEGVSYIVTSSGFMQAELGSTISVNFSSGGPIGVTNQLFLRKQIIPLLS